MDQLSLLLKLLAIHCALKVFSHVVDFFSPLIHGFKFVHFKCNVLLHISDSCNNHVLVNCRKIEL